jgi:hypothetical protein
MIALTALIVATHSKQDLNPVFWMDAKGNILINGTATAPQVNPGVYRVNTPSGVAYSFAGGKSGILFGDNPALKLGGDMTVSAWIYPRSYAINGWQSQILFRGDDRNDFDPYAFAMTSEGTVYFKIEDENSAGMMVNGEVPLNTWTHVMASLNAKTGDMYMYVNGVEVSHSRTSKRPFLNLIPRYTPGVGVGNVQNDKGPQNQPFNGMIADLRLYAKALTPEEAGFVPDHATAAQP